MTQRCSDGLKRIKPVTIALDQHTVKDFVDQVAAERTRAPILGSSYGARAVSDGGRQRGQEQHDIEMARMVGDVDALFGRQRAALPSRLSAGQQAYRND